MNAQTVYQLAQALNAQSKRYTVPFSRERRREIQMGGISFEIRASDDGFAGAFWALCEKLDSIDPPLDGEDTNPVPRLEEGQA